MKSNQFKNVDKRKKFDSVLSFLHIITAILFIILVIYLFALQVFDFRHYKKYKNQRSFRNFIMRGSILDRNGMKLASDKSSYTVYAHQSYYDRTNNEEVKNIAEKLSPILNISVAELEKKLKKDTPIVNIKKDLDTTTAKQVNKLRLRAINAEREHARIYPQGSMASHILGYYNPLAQLATGIEEEAKDKLEYVSSNSQMERTQSGDIVYDFSTDPKLTTGPQVGKSVTLTIDSAIQHVCETELYKMIREKNALRGAVIVMNPKNGEILGYAVYPYFNPNEFRKATPTQLKNWSLTDVFPPGSTFKVLTVASAMELGKINENSRVEDTGKIKLGWWPIENYDYYKNPYPGWISLEYLFEHSSNVGSIKVAQKMTAEEFYGMLKKFGIGEKTGIDLPAESNGILPPPNTWDVARHGAMGYGYGASVTPIQMASAVSAIANNGVRVTPHVIKYSEEEKAQKIKAVRVMSEVNAKKLAKILAKSIANSKSPLNLDSYSIAAKTGTSRKTREGMSGYSNKLYASAVGFLPANNPQVLIYVVVDSAQGGAIWGSTVAVPVFKEVALQSARILNIAPDKQSNKK